MSEKELDLNDDAPENIKPVEGESEDVKFHKTAANQEIVSLGKNMSDDEFLQALASAPAEMIIPWEETPLPSDGLYYEGWKNGTVKVRAMTQSVEKSFANRRLIQSGEAIDRMFRHCVELPGGMDPLDLMVGDRTYLLYYIRGITFGNMYKFVATCPHCSAENSHTYDMNELFSTVIRANPSLGAEPFKIRLPHLSAITDREINVGIRFLRARDVNDMVSKQRFQKRLDNKTVRAANPRRGRPRPVQNQVDPAEALLEGSLEKTIVSVNGNSDPNVIRPIVARMHSLDNSEIRQFLKDHTPGIDTTVNVECSDCGNEAVMGLPITEGFFRAAK